MYGYMEFEWNIGILMLWDQSVFSFGEKELSSVDRFARGWRKIATAKPGGFGTRERWGSARDCNKTRRLGGASPAPTKGARTATTMTGNDLEEYEQGRFRYSGGEFFES